MYKKIIQVGFISRELKRIMDSCINIYVSAMVFIEICPENVKSMTVYGKKQGYEMKLLLPG